MRAIVGTRCSRLVLPAATFSAAAAARTTAVLTPDAAARRALSRAAQHSVATAGANMATVPHAALRWDATPAAVTAQAAGIMTAAGGVLDAVADALRVGGPAACTWATTMGPLAQLDRDVEAQLSAVIFLKDVSPSAEVRAAAAAAQAALNAWEVKAGMRKDVFDAVDAYVRTHLEADRAAMDAEAARFAEHTHRDYRRRGLALPAAARAEVEELKTRMSTLCVEFQQRLAEDTTRLHLTRDELRGMPDDFVAALAVKSAAGDAAQAGADAAGATVLEVELHYAHVMPLLKLCAVPATRAAVERAFNSRGAPANVAALQELAELRRRLAGLLGYEHHAAFVLEDKMAGSAAAVREFLAKLARDLRPLHEADLATLNALKAAEEGASAGPVSMADRTYYQEQDLKRRYDVDHNAIKEFFPLATVLAGMLGIYERILQLQFALVPPDAVAPEHVWHPDVRLYRVTDARDSSLAGWFYLDLHPRDGKYGHAAVFPLVSGCADGPVGLCGDDAAPRVVPVAACVCNFTKPSATTPSLLQHSEVETLFHEFGHVAHHLCSATRLHRHASFRCQNDFVEAPSQVRAWERASDWGALGARVACSYAGRAAGAGLRARLAPQCAAPHTSCTRTDPALPHTARPPPLLHFPHPTRCSRTGAGSRPCWRS